MLWVFSHRMLEAARCYTPIPNALVVQRFYSSYIVLNPCTDKKSCWK